MDVGRIAFICKDMSEPMLAVCLPFDGGDCRTGNDAMVAFPASSKDEVKALYDKAISLGATDEGEPGQRIPVRFYGAYARDLDGNKLCFFVFGSGVSPVRNISTGWYCPMPMMTADCRADQGIDPVFKTP